MSKEDVKIYKEKLAQQEEMYKYEVKEQEYLAIKLGDTESSIEAMKKEENIEAIKQSLDPSIPAILCNESVADKILKDQIKDRIENFKKADKEIIEKDNAEKIEEIEKAEDEVKALSTIWNFDN